jgi:hypothetical protein
MENLKVDLKRKTLRLDGVRKYWWKIKQQSSSSSEDATDTRVWYTDSNKYGYVDDHKIKISKIRELEEQQGGEPIDWQHAKHRITTPEKLESLNELVDRAEKEQRKREAKKHKAASDVPKDQEEHAHSRPETEGDRPIKPPSVKRISKTEYEVDWGKYVYYRDMGEWTRRKHGAGESEQHRERDKETLKLLEKVIAEFKESESKTRKSSEQKEPASRKIPEKSSKQKRPKFAERSKHGGLIVHGLADSRYYTRFDIGKSKKYPKGFTFRMGRGKLYILETLDRESLAAIEKEISWVLRS